MLYRLMASATPSREEPLGGDESAGLALEECTSCSSMLALQANHSKGVMAQHIQHCHDGIGR